MKRPERYRVAGAMLLAVVAAEGARRLLSPRERPIEPAPVDLRDYFSPSEIERGSRYARPQRALSLARSAVDLAAISFLVLRPPAWLTRPGHRPVAGGALAGALLATGLALPTLPLSAIARRRAMAVGLDTQSWPDWGRDLTKAGAISGIFASGAGAAVVAATRQWPRSWWAPAAAGSVMFGAVLAALAPVVLAPIFNDFTRLPEGETRRDVLDLAAAAGVRVGEVYSIDASRRTTAANAYVTGLGPTKRVVLFDTLLDRYSRDEVRMVVAHELGHVRYRDVPRNIAYAALIAPATALAVQRLSWALSTERGTPATLPSLALAAGLVTAPVGVIGNRLSRALERRADQYSLELAGAPAAFVAFERTIALQNVADLKPPRWISRLMATHPPTDERIGAAVAFAASHPA
ncbi:MAG: M48 family metalloprotease [Solirubrobacteraceae bacterium]